MRYRFLAFVLCLCAISPQSHADEMFEEISYEELLREMNAKTTAKAPAIIKTPDDFFESVMIHAGLGLINSQIGIEAGGKQFFRQKSGFQLAVGIDLISPYWHLEGALRNYGQDDEGSETYSLREFDLKIVHEIPVSKVASIRLGGGLAARYLDYNKKVATPATNPKGEESAASAVGDLPVENSAEPALKDVHVSDSTPSAIAFIGLDFYAMKNMSFGMDFNTRSSLIADTSDRFSMDVTFRIDSHF